MTTRISSKGQIVLPGEIRKRDSIHPGDEFTVQRLDEGEYLLKKVAPANRGLVDLLLGCPSKDWFVPFERNETTRDIDNPSFQ